MRSIEEVFPNRLCGVLRTENADAGFQACLAAVEGGVHTIEITKTVPSCFELIRGLIATTGGRYPVGVGTVWDPGAVREAKDAGASFVVTPAQPVSSSPRIRRRVASANALKYASTCFRLSARAAEPMSYVTGSTRLQRGTVAQTQQ